MDTKIFDEAYAALPTAIKKSKPICTMILGSGWSRAISGMEVLAEVPYGAIPHFGDVTVIGHTGRLVLVRLPSGGEALVFCGRRHWYEGAGWETVLMPAEITRRIGVKTLLITNASGGIRKDMKAGDMVVIRDHIRLNHLNPLRGPHHPDFGPRFPDQTHVYTPALVEALLTAGRDVGIELTTGVYIFSSGPSFETPAEIRAYEILGADLVGMSTVPEAMFASACGIQVAGLSFVSNMAAGISCALLSGSDVIDCANENADKMSAIVRSFLARIDVRGFRVRGSRLATSDSNVHKGQQWKK